MTAYAALLRGINVGGSGKLSMQDLAALCNDSGCRNVRTYIQSGNAVFTSSLAERKVKQSLEKALAEKLGKPVAVLVRTSAELESVIRRNPFGDAKPNQVLVLFLDEAPPRKVFLGLDAPGGEEVKPDGREVFVHYPQGMGRSKLKLPLVAVGTGRNLNTVRKLAEMARELA
jgi:uncharacterized protein (DUF1697 family)